MRARGGGVGGVGVGGTNRAIPDTAAMIVAVVVVVVVVATVFEVIGVAVVVTGCERESWRHWCRQHYLSAVQRHMNRRRWWWVKARALTGFLFGTQDRIVEILHPLLLSREGL
jgi:hypothetical protein